MNLKLIRQDCKGSEQFVPIVLGVGKHVLGRGPPLKCKDSRISRSHCILEVSEDGNTKLTANHINPCFYTSVCPETSVKIIRKGEDSVLNDGDLISLLPDAYRFSVRLIKDDSATDGGESETDMETDTQEIQTKQDVKGSSAQVNGDRVECENDKTVNLSDNEIAYPGSEDSGAEDEQGRDGVPSPSLLDAVPASLLEDGSSDKGESSTKTDENVEGSSSISGSATTEKRQSDAAGGEGGESPSAKRHRPNSPQDVKPDLVALEAMISTTSSSETGPQSNVASVKTEPADGKEAVSVKKEPSDPADSAAGCSVGPGAGTEADSGAAAGADVKEEDSEEAGGSADPAKSTPNRTKCSFGLGCYRKNAIHREEYSHPGDADFTAPTPCQFGAGCYRQNPQHRALYTHPGPPAPRPPPPAPHQPGNKRTATKKRAAKTTKKKRPSYSGTDSEDEYDMEDPFLAADSSDDYEPETDLSSSGEDGEEDEESQNTKRDNRRMLREAKKFTGKK